jgi:hypothetical protein
MHTNTRQKPHTLVWGNSHRHKQEGNKIEIANWQEQVEALKILTKRYAVPEKQEHALPPKQNAPLQQERAPRNINKLRNILHRTNRDISRKALKEKLEQLRNQVKNLEAMIIERHQGNPIGIENTREKIHIVEEEITNIQEYLKMIQ